MPGQTRDPWNDPNQGTPPGEPPENRPMANEPANDRQYGHQFNSGQHTHFWGGEHRHTHHYGAREAVSPAAVEPTPAVAEPASAAVEPTVRERQPFEGGNLALYIIAGVLFLLVLLALIFGIRHWDVDETPTGIQITQTAATAPATVTPTASDENVARVSISDLGTVAHHVGEVTIPQNGMLVVIGDLHQDGSTLYKQYNPGDNLNALNGLPGDSQLWTINGTHPDEVKHAFDEFLRDNHIEGRDP